MMAILHIYHLFFLMYFDEGLFLWNKTAETKAKLFFSRTVFVKQLEAIFNHYWLLLCSNNKAYFFREHHFRQRSAFFGKIMSSLHNRKRVLNQHDKQVYHNRGFMLFFYFVFLMVHIVAAHSLYNKYTIFFSYFWFTGIAFL